MGSSTSVTLDAQVLLTWVGLIVAVVTAIAATGRWIIKSLDRRIGDATKALHPEANGGKSLNDLHLKVDILSDEQSRLAEANRRQVEELKTELGIHRYRLAQLDELLRGHKEWT